MKRTLFEPEHEAFRETCRTFCDKEIVPNHEQWERDHIVPRDVWLAAGRQGLLGFSIPEEYGGGGVDDFRFNTVLGEELVRVGASGPGFGLHVDIVAPYLLKLANDEQKQRWFPGFADGSLISAIAMTEPAAGSDLQGMKSTARRDGNHYVLNGSKTFITNGINSDLVIVAAKTDPTAGHKGISLVVVERGMPGFERGRNLDKIGMKAQDTAELFFDNVEVPVENLLGDEGRGFIYLMENLPQERLSMAVIAVAACERMLAITLDYCREREAFGTPIGSFQATRFTLAEISTETSIARTYVDECIKAHVAGALAVEDAAKAKWWATELQGRVADRCLQLFGGYGYMSEYPISKAWLDSRVQRIYGGTTEIMKEIIARHLPL
jgi:alkylation response protein AidB-like acyl-CoA dehydrogenase